MDSTSYALSNIYNMLKRYFRSSIHQVRTSRYDSWTLISGWRL